MLAWECSFPLVLVLPAPVSYTVLAIGGECHDPPWLRSHPRVEFTPKYQITTVIKIHNCRGHPLPRPKRIANPLQVVNLPHKRN